MVFDEFDCFLRYFFFPIVNSMTLRYAVILEKNSEDCLRLLSRFITADVFLGCPTPAAAEVIAATNDGRNATRRTCSHSSHNTPKDSLEC